MKTMVVTCVHLCAVLLVDFFPCCCSGQGWSYNFGTGVGVETSSIASTTFLPTPATGIARVRAGTGLVSGSFSLSNPGISVLGSGSELQLTANIGSVSPTKFSVYDYTPGKVGTITFSIAFGGGTDGVYRFALGNGSSFSDNNAISNAHVFASIRWSFGLLNTINYQVLNNNTYSIIGLLNSGTQFVQDTGRYCKVSIFANNEITPKTYVQSGVRYTLQGDTWDLWIAGVRVGVGLASGGLNNLTDIDSYAFYHQSNALLPGTLYIDDINYWNALPETVIELSKDSIATFGNIDVGLVSGSDSLMVKAADLAGPITVTCPANIEVSIDNVHFYNTINLLDTLGNLVGDSVRLYIRFTPIISGLIDDRLTISSPGFTDTYIHVSGVGISTHSGESDLVIDSTFVYEQYIDYKVYQANDIVPAQSIELAQLILRDGGAALSDADTLPTTLTELGLEVGYSNQLRRIALYDGTTELIEMDASNEVLFSGLNIVANDNNVKSFSIRVSFDSSVIDRTQFYCNVLSTVTNSNGSLMRVANAGFATSSTQVGDNTIEVVADRITWVQQPISTNVNEVISPALQLSVTDSFGNKDINFTHLVSLVSTGILASSQNSSLPLDGLVEFSSVIHSEIGTAISLTASAATLPSSVSSPFDILDPVVSIVSFPTSWSGTPADVSSVYADDHLINQVVLTRGAGLMAQSSSARFNSSNWSTATSLVFGSNQSFLTFSLTTENAYLINLNDAVLQFTLSSSATGPTNYAIYTSVEGFDSLTAQVGINLTTASTSIMFPSTGYDNLSSVEIRIYGWNANSSAGTGGVGSLELIARNSPIQYVFNGSWIPSIPMGTSTVENTINIQSGLAVISSELKCNHLLISSNAKLVIDPGHTLTIQGVINGEGKIVGSNTSHLVIQGTGKLGLLLMDQTSSSSRSLGSLVLNRNDSGSLIVGDSLVICDSLVLYNGIVYTNGKLRLQSTQFRTACIPTIVGTGGVVGNITAECYVPGSARRWRFMSSPFSDATFEDMRQEIYVTGAGIGTTIGTLNSNGFDATLSNQPSVYSYNERIAGNLNIGWEALTNSTTTLSNQPIVAGKGYRVFIRGDRSDSGSLNGTNNSQNQVTINLTGTINQGNIIMPVSYTVQYGQADDGWNLVGNPYPCAYNWKAMMDDGTHVSHIDSTIYILDATSGSYKSYNSFSGGGTLSNGIIPMGASFWVKANDVNPVLIFTEAFKSTTPPVALFKTSSANELQLQLELDSVTKDLFVLAHHSASTTMKDAYDIRKLNGEVNIMSVGSDGISLTYDARPVQASNDTVRLYVSGGNRTYTLKVLSIPQSGKYYYLVDRKLDSMILLATGLTYSFTSVTTDTSSYGYRFQLIISGNQTLPIRLIDFTATKIYQTIQLDWLSVFAYKQFDVERSCGATTNWKRIGTMDGLNDHQKNRHYQFVDEYPALNKVNYYRVKMIDPNEEVVYSDVRAVFLEPAELQEIVLAPNPTSGEMDVYSIEPNQQLSVWDLNGTRLLITDMPHLELGLLDAGLYCLRIETKTGIFTRKISKY
jgi:hypothetical protein